MTKKIKKRSFIKRFFGGIYKIIDKILITPISKFIYYLTDKISLNSIRQTKIFNNPNTLVLLSLLFAFIAFFAIDIKGVNLVSTESTVLTHQNIDVEYNDEAYVVEGIPESADIVLLGSKSNLYLAEQLESHKLTLDLSGLGEGTHKVNLKYNSPIKSLDYKLDPSTVTVVIRPKVSESRTLSKDILNTDKLNEKLVVSSVTLEKDEVIIKSYKEKLATVASVKAIVDINALGIEQAGTFESKEVKLVAYDENGIKIDDIQIIPSSVKATISVASPSKTVDIKVVPIGEVASGSAISSIETNVNKVTIYGDEEVLKDITELQVEIDVNGLTSDKTYQENINKPTGVRSVSEDVITINVKMETETSKEFENVPIQFENLDEKYTALAVSTSDTKVNVIVKGVSTVLNNLTTDDIKAYVDLSDLKPGTYDIPIEVTGKDLKLNYTTRTSKVTVVIKEK